MGATINRKFYDLPRSDNSNRTKSHILFPAEAAILSSVRARVKGKAILEIGVGAGRVTPHLQALTRHYVGFDYSPVMIEAAKVSYPGAQLFVHDATDMSAFKTGEFDAGFFCGQGIDDVKLADRVRILNEVHRVLKADGIFVFSSHNLDWREIPSYAFPEFSYSSGLFAFILDNFLDLVAYFVTVLKYLFSKSTSRGQTAIWEYVRTPKRFLLPIVYIRPAAQIRQLHLAGFHHVEAVASDGAPLTEQNRDKDYFVYYVAAKGDLLDG